MRAAQPRLVGLHPHPDRVHRAFEILWMENIAKRLRKIQWEWLRKRGITPPQSDAVEYVQDSKDFRKSWGSDLVFGSVDHHEFVAKAKMDDPFDPPGGSEELPEWFADPSQRAQAVDDLIKLIEKYLNDQFIDDETTRSAVMSYMGGREKQKLSRVKIVQLPGLIRELPDNYQEISDQYRTRTGQDIRPDQLRFIQQVQSDSAGQLRMNLIHLEGGIRDVLHESVYGQWTVRKIQQELFNRFGQMNRDWRREAVTRASEMSSNGFLSGLEYGTRVRSVEAYWRVCDWCRSFSHGRVFTVVPTDYPGRDPEKHVWEGKNNWGVSRDSWTVAAGPNHYHCRKQWAIQSRPKRST